MFMDSQSLAGDPYVKMGAWAMLTDRLKLAPGVTNPLTRHPAVTAAAAAKGRVPREARWGDTYMGLRRTLCDCRAA